MGPVEPIQHEGHVPKYFCYQIDWFEGTFDELGARDILCYLEDLKVVLDYLNPSFLVKKLKKWQRLY